MPLYEYLCSTCNKEHELLVRNRDEVPECPDCGGVELSKLISAHAAPTGGTLGMLPGACPPSDAPPCSPNCCRL